MIESAQVYGRRSDESRSLASGHRKKNESNKSILHIKAIMTIY